MIEDAEQRGILNGCSTLSDRPPATFGIGLAMVAAAKGFTNWSLTMPESINRLERRRYLAANELVADAQGEKNAGRD